MKISVFGLGYVGAVTAACMAERHDVVGVDVNSEKVAMMNAARTPIIEPGLDQLLESAVASRRIRATTDPVQAVMETEVSLICVGTPPAQKGGPDLSSIYKVCNEIGFAVFRKRMPHVIVLRSTVPPGTLDYCRSMIMSKSEDVPVHLASNPEFLREGSAVRDYYRPPYIVIGTEDRIAENAVRLIYADIESPVFVVKPALAEMLKCVSNTWHATKIAFANEIGRIAKGFDIDGREVMNLIVQDTKLNISPVYMRPGFAYGGSCLPKDVAALLRYAQKKGIPTPFLNALPETNRLQVELAVQKVLRINARKVAVFGLAFKPRTDDLRESPAVILVKRLLGEGCRVSIYDKAVYKASLVGSNLGYIKQNLPHFEALMSETPQQALEDSELIIITHPDPEFLQLLREASVKLPILDLAGLFTEPPEDAVYYGISW